MFCTIRSLERETNKLGRVLHVHKDLHGIVRTVTFGVRGKAGADKALPYVPRPLDDIVLGVQRLVVICPMEEQVDVGNYGNRDDLGATDAVDATGVIDVVDGASQAVQTMDSIENDEH